MKMPLVLASGCQTMAPLVGRRILPQPQWLLRRDMARKMPLKMTCRKASARTLRMNQPVPFSTTICSMRSLGTPTLSHQLAGALLRMKRFRSSRRQQPQEARHSCAGASSGDASCSQRRREASRRHVHGIGGLLPPVVRRPWPSGKEAKMLASGGSSIGACKHGRGDISRSTSSCKTSARPLLMIPWTLC